MAVIGGQQPGEFKVTAIVMDPVAGAQFYIDVLGAQETRRHLAEGLKEVPDGTVTAVELRLSGIVLVLTRQNPRFRDGKWSDGRRTDWPRCPEVTGTSTASFSLYVDDVDSTLAKALAHGATLMHPSHEIEDTPWGDRIIQFFDPMGHVWQIMTRLEDVAEEELPARIEAQRERMRQARRAAITT